ncbi:hypothetical protein [Streptomyces sp. L2]|uniref:hypothetical protein n=1 Tax=Streptomyces sp. L2 TaxID=2162665 RepID=UPI001F5120EA|nr:hypothetical protein [Streptomyces sp. L2]
MCTAQIDNPHFSNGAGRVIFNGRMSCTSIGNTPQVNLRVLGILGYVPGGSPGHPAQGPPGAAATSDQTHTVPTNGQQVTYYTPIPGDPKKITATGTYTGSVTFQIVSPALGTPTSYRSNRRSGPSIPLPARCSTARCTAAVPST